jgi:UDP-3-O-[3-hydroxymyristoyl] N-acetylglucosamine deacetylase
MSGRRRQTLARPSAVLSGVGLHSGAGASVRLLPAPLGAGLVFRRAGSGQEIQARVSNVSDTSRCTRLKSGGFEVQTVEHVLSALAGLGVDDAVVEMDGGSEVPAMDGSAAPFAAALLDAGLHEQSQSVEAITPTQPMFVSERGSTIVVLPSETLSLTVVLDYPRQAYLGAQAAIFDGAGEYATQIAPARTYGFLSEIDALRAAGLGLGASLDNAVVLGETRYETPLRFSNELARHKLLDLLGDLALAGRPVCADIIAVKPGHTLNVRLAQRLSEL